MIIVPWLLFEPTYRAGELPGSDSQLAAALRLHRHTWTAYARCLELMAFWTARGP